MHLLSILRLRLKALLSSGRLDTEIDEEVRFHIERESEALIKQGFSPNEARDRASRLFGPELLVKEECRDARGLRLWDEFSQDLHYSFRSLLGAPILTLAIILTIALGIGANTAVFSVIYSVILRPLPYPSPEQLVWVTQYFPRFEARLVSGNDFLTWEGQSVSFDSLAAWSAGAYAVQLPERPEQLRGVSVSQDYFPALGVQPLAGRLFLPDEHGPQGNEVVLIGERLWREYFSASAAAIGQSLSIGQRPHIIVGVIPRRGEHVEEGDFWIPLRLSHAQIGEAINLVRVMGRLKPGVSVQAAKSDLEVLARRSQEEQFGGPSDSTTEVIPLHEKLVGNVKQSLFLLWAAVDLVLLLVCANVANLLLGRMAGRANELSLKLSLGARRFRLVRQLLTESLILSLTGAAVGALLAALGMPLLLELLPADVPRQETVTIDAGTLFFTLCVTVLAAVAFGTLPALQPMHTNLSHTLKASGRMLVGSRVAKWAQDGLVVSQFALATLIVFTAGLLTHSFLKLRAVDPGFGPDGLLTAGVQLPSSQYQEASQQRAFFLQALGRIRVLPGVSHVAVATALPFSRLDGSLALFSVKGRPVWGPEEAAAHRTRVHYVSPELFETLSVPLLDGQRAVAEDASDVGRVVVSSAFARRAFGTNPPIGGRLKLGIPEGPEPWLTVVGVVGDIRHSAIDVDDVPVVYRSFTEASSLLAAALLVRSSRDSLSLVPEVREAIREIDAAQPLHGVMTMRQRMARTVASERDRALLIGGFAALALVIAGAGVFGVLSHLVARRRRELGVRMAIGANTRDVFRMVLGRGLGLAALGTACGYLVAMPVARVLQGFLYDIQVIDLGSLLATSAILIAVAFLACYVPARRASGLDPASVLRWE